MMGTVAFWGRKMQQHQPSSTAPTPSPERAALAEAIDAKRAADERLAALRKAHQTAESALYTKRRGIDIAETALEQAKTDAAAHMVAVASGTAGHAPTSIKIARATCWICRTTSPLRKPPGQR